MTRAIRMAPDLTQEKHIAGLPIGTRGGAVVPYNFPVDAEYDISIRLARDRNEHVEGLKVRTDVPLGRMDDPVMTFSGGMRQRVQLAKALANRWIFATRDVPASTEHRDKHEAFHWSRKSVASPSPTGHRPRPS